MTDNIKIYVVLISIVLSYLSYQFLEKKLKKNFKNLLSFVTIFSILSFAMIFLYSINNGYESRLKFTNFYKILYLKFLDLNSKLMIMKKT